MEAEPSRPTPSEGSVDAERKPKPSPWSWSGLYDRATSRKREVEIWYSILIYDEHWLGLVIQVVLSPVVWILTAGLPIAVLAAMNAPPPDDGGGGPAQDSGFWSALSQALAGLAGFVAILSSLRRPKKRQRRCWGTPQEYEWRIDSNYPRTFVVLLASSGLTGVLGFVVYPFQAPSSLVLAFVASMGQTLATSLLVQESMQQISELEHIVSENGP